jgi:hypothetical protein
MARRCLERLKTPALVVAGALMLATGAMAAPTCQAADGHTLRCGTPGAMPVGWSVPDDFRAEDPDIEVSELLGLALVIGGLFALIARMPDFEGPRGADWDAQEEDRDQRG